MAGKESASKSVYAVKQVTDRSDTALLGIIVGALFYLL